MLIFQLGRILLSDLMTLYIDNIHTSATTGIQHDFDKICSGVLYSQKHNSTRHTVYHLISGTPPPPLLNAIIGPKLTTPQSIAKGHESYVVSFAAEYPGSILYINSKYMYTLEDKTSCQ